MQKKKKKKTTWKFHIFARNIFALFLVCFLCYSLYINITREKIEFETVSFVNLPLESEHKALLMREEKLVKSLSSGSFAPSVTDGEYVKLNQKVGVFTVKDVEIPVNESVNNQQFQLVSEEELQQEADKLYKILAEHLRNKEYIKAKMVKGELDMKLRRLTRLIEANSDIAYTEETNLAIGEQTATVGEEIEIHSDSAGIVSYLLDSYEAIASYENRYKINYDEIFSQSIEAKDYTASDLIGGQYFLKIISPFEWYLACQIELSEMLDFRVDQEVIITLKNKLLKGKIVDVFEGGQKGIMLVAMQSRPDDFHSFRLADVKIKQSEARGVKVTNDCLVSKNDLKGVYQVDSNEQIYFTAVKVLAEIEDYVIVQESAFSLLDEEGNLERINSLKHGDKVVRYAAKYREGEIVE